MTAVPSPTVRRAAMPAGRPEAGTAPTRRSLLRAGVAAGSLLALGAVRTGAGTPPIPRRELLSLPDREQPAVSPDGGLIAWIAPHGGARNLWLAPAGRIEAARPLTAFDGHGLARPVPLTWTANGRALIVGRDADGDENFRLLAVPVDGGPPVPLTPEEARAGIVGVSPADPDRVLASHNGRDRRLFDGVLVDVGSGAARTVFRNPGVVDFWADRSLTVRLGVRRQPDGGHGYVAFTPDGTERPAGTVAFADMQTTAPLGWSADGRTLYWRDSRDRDTAALVAESPDGSRRELGADPAADVDAVAFDPVDGRPMGWRSTRERPRWTALTSAFRAELEALRTADPGDVGFMNRSADGRRALVWFNRDDGPARFALFDRDSGRTRFLFSSKDSLSALPLVPMRPVTVRSRDGLDLVCYLTLPRVPADGRPLVLLVHGGPWSRDSWGFVAGHQLLADRGYAVLSVNFRGSVGFGKRFVNAGNGEWGARMQDDLLDAVDWAVAQGHADPARVGIMGASYGGYAALAGLTMTPQRFACGIAAAAMANLVTFLETAPPYWKPNAAMWHRRLGGDPATPEGRAFLESRSPLTHLDRLSRPLLLGHGANDPRVKRSEADAVAAAAAGKGLPLVHALFPDEGHGFVRPANRLAWWALVEAFLARTLGGRAEPPGRDLEGTSLRLEAGGDLVPEIAGALR